MIEIVLATTNLHKIREFKEIFKPLKHIELFSLSQFSNYKAAEETGATFLENATIKAVDAAKQLGKLVIADDSGLVVPALQGAPGVKSARYAGVMAVDVENRKKLLEAMSNLNDEERAAYFECCLVIASPEKILKKVTATCEGTILKEERGRNGFGYDALFIKHDYDKSFAELNESIKNRISHRRKAIDKLLPFLESLVE